MEVMDPLNGSQRHLIGLSIFFLGETIIASHAGFVEFYSK